ncbi:MULTISPECIES: phosphodiester glycosidase family protein [unclassified Sphingobacterium]|uniref:phosphodiester glycosidase family protein n=1 Tax=unclassified Sphingobacterium TaxID=2609468 RepID=UPI0025E9C856|nr:MULTISPECIES: phosphodiester glycosidase family protein [unclassified Sphingobacterium]
MKSSLKFLSLSVEHALTFVVTSVFIVSAFTSCKQRDDWPVFENKEVIVEKDTIPPDNQIGALTQSIITNTDIIKTFRLDSTTTVAEGIVHTHIRYLNRLNLPVSMHVLEIDLSKPKLAVQALGPFNEVLYATQILPEMAKYNESGSGGKMMVAINGDAVLTSGTTVNAPSGSYIRYGRQIKTNTTTATAFTIPYFAVTKAGVPFIGNRPSATYPAEAVDLNTIYHLVSGTNWLVFNNNLITSTTATVSARTAIGINADKKVICVVVDGGDDAFSTGITLNDLGVVMKTLGSSRAFFTNGGNFSAMVKRKEDAKGLRWDMLNRPVNKTGSATANGIGFVLRP